MKNAEETENMERRELDGRTQSYSEWSIVRIKKARLFSFVQYHSHRVTVNATLFSLREMPLSWKENVFHTGRFFNYKSILWTGGSSLRNRRQACFFSHLNPQDSSSRQRTIEWTGPNPEPRLLLYKQRNRPDHD